MIRRARVPAIASLAYFLASTATMGQAGLSGRQTASNPLGPEAVDASQSASIIVTVADESGAALERRSGGEAHEPQ